MTWFLIHNQDFSMLFKGKPEFEKKAYTEAMLFLYRRVDIWGEHANI